LQVHLLLGFLSSSIVWMVSLDTLSRVVYYAMVL
jgi:hypothetical protein